MKEIWFAIWTGIIGGVVTSFIVLVIAEYWKAIFLPWFENRVYQGVRIEGRWKSQWMFKGEVRTEYATLWQRAHQVHGRIEYSKDSLGHSHNYELTGTIFDTSFTALTHEVGNARLERGALVLSLRPGTPIPIMKGFAVWFDGNEPVTVENAWTQEK